MMMMRKERKKIKNSFEDILKLFKTTKKNIN
jgi:hypothetical protein